MSFEELNREVKQDIANERFERYLPGIIALAVSVLIGVSGYKGYQYYQEQESLKAAEMFYGATRTLLHDREAGLQELDNVIQDPASLGYQPLAQFTLAAEYVDNNNRDAARSILLDLADNPKTPHEFIVLATIQAAMLTGDSSVNADLQSRLAPYLAPEHLWRHLARVAAAELALAAGDTAKAKEIFQIALEDDLTPPSLNRRFEKILNQLP